MDLRRLCLLTVVCLAGLGCRRDPYMDAYLEMLNSEKRVLEDRLYEVEYDYQKALKELEACRSGEKKAPRREQSQAEQAAPAAENEQIDADERDLEIPEIELPPGFESGYKLPPDKPAFRTASASRPPPDKTAVRKRVLSNQELAEAIISALDQTVDHLAINARVTGGAELDDDPGDDGITVLVEPRNRNGHFVASPGALTIVLLDPALRGEAARIARWDISQASAQKALRSASLDRGMQFQLPWSDARPSNDRLHLFVRYQCQDGRALEAEHEIQVDSPGRIAHCWTPRPERSPKRDRPRARLATAPSPTPASELQPEAIEATEATVIQTAAEEPITVPDEALSTPDPSAPRSPARPAAGRRLWRPER